LRRFSLKYRQPAKAEREPRYRVSLNCYLSWLFGVEWLILACQFGSGKEAAKLPFVG
jgi:hypothetical protein